MAALVERERVRPIARRGRPMDPETKGRIREAAAFLRLGHSPAGFAQYIYPDKHTPESAFRDLRGLLNDYAIRVKIPRGRLPEEKARAIVDAVRERDQTSAAKT